MEVLILDQMILYLIEEMTNTDVYAAVKDRVNLLSSRGNNDVTSGDQ